VFDVQTHYKINAILTLWHVLFVQRVGVFWQN